MLTLAQTTSIKVTLFAELIMLTDALDKSIIIMRWEYSAGKPESANN